MSSESIVLALGVLLSILWSVLRAPNPARIPFQRLAFRAAGGVVTWIVASWAGAWALWRLVLQRPAAEHLTMPATLFSAFALGLLVPQVGKLKDILIPHSVARHIQGPLRLVQELDEFTRLYLARIIAREERKINFEFFDVPPEELERRERALHQMFEFHQVEIAMERRRHNQHSEQILSTFRFQSRDVRFKMLLRFLGCHRTLRSLEALAAHPNLLKRGTGEYVQRDIDSSYVRSYVLGREPGA